MPFSFRRLRWSFRHAARGLASAWRGEQNLRLQAAAGLAVLAAAAAVEVPTAAFLALTLAVTMVLVLELVNTAVEQLLDLLSPRLHHAAGRSKDLLAAAVLVAASGAALVAAVAFWPLIAAW